MTLWPLYWGAFLATFVFSLANVAGPGIRVGLAVDAAELSLIVAVFAASFAAAIVLGGRLGDRYGRRRLFIGGMAGLAAASLIFALSWNSASAIIARVFEGLAAAAMMPQILAIIQSQTVGRTRARSISAFAASAGVGTVAGQVLGGGLISLGGVVLGWRLAFAVFAAMAGLGAWAGRRLPAGGGDRSLRIDGLGALPVAIAFGCLITGLAIGTTSGWGTDSWLLVSLAVLGVIAIVLQQSRAERRQLDGRGGADPLLPPTVLRDPAIGSGMVMAFTYFAGYGAFLFNFAQLTQVSRQDPAWLSGLILAPFCLVFLTVSLVCHQLTALLGGPRVLLFGAVGQAAGLIGIGVVSLMQPTEWELWIQIPIASLGAGQALQFSPLVATVMEQVPGRLAGLTGGLISTMQQAGIAIGVAGLGAWYSALTVIWDPLIAFAVMSFGQIALALGFGLGAVRLLKMQAASDRVQIDCRSDDVG